MKNIFSENSFWNIKTQQQQPKAFEKRRDIETWKVSSSKVFKKALLDFFLVEDSKLNSRSIMSPADFQVNN